MGDFGGGFNSGDFFSGVIASIEGAISAIVAALNYMWKVLVEAINFAWNALLAVAKVLGHAVKLIARGFVHVLSDIVHGRFLHLFQDYLDLKAKLTAWLGPVLRILMRIRQLFQSVRARATAALHQHDSAPTPVPCSLPAAGVSSGRSGWMIHW